jgi:AraC-like DNA-binding protein
VTTSPTLRALLQAAVSALFPDVPVEEREKADILGDVMARHGWAAVLQVGAELRRRADHPVVRGVVASPDPRSVLQRWTLLERFAHSSNRVEALKAAENYLTVRHVACDGSTIPRVNDLFVWGVLLSLFELAGASNVRATFGEDEADGSFCFHPQPASTELPEATHTATFCFTPGVLSTLPLAPTGTVRERVHALIRRDPLASWTASAAAAELGLSTRSLQRALQAERTSFSETLQRARVACAETLLGDARLSLTEIAFCCGFADQAHFSRTFRKFTDVPPSLLREAALRRLG